MRIYDIIEKKRDSTPLSKEEIEFFVRELTSERIEDYQATALIMAMFINGMNREETVNLTTAMAHSGDMLDLSSVNGPTADKHSTGGVGDKTSFIVAPICASLGIKMAKMSGRGLGHTGGTIDKLESIPGYKVSLSTEEFFEQVNKIGIALIGQTGNLAPADKKIYALRDATATVDNTALITSSIMSKKLAAGAENIVLDVKCGSGAFMKTEKDAKALAEMMVQIGKDCNKNISAVITNMDIPLGTHIGNSLEVSEAVDILKNGGDLELRELCLVLSANIISLALKKSFDESYKNAVNALESGKALKKFKELVSAQGGDISVIDDTDLLPKAKYSFDIISQQEGYISSMDSRLIGESSVLLGAGREKKDDTIDYSAGIILCKKTGDKISVGDKIATLYSNDKSKFLPSSKVFISSITVSDGKPTQKPLILNTIR